MNTRALMVLILGLLPPLSHAQIAFPEARKWRLGEDFVQSLTSPTSPDRYGNTDTWQFVESSFNSYNVANWTPLPERTSGDNAGVNGWQSTGGDRGVNPAILFNQGARNVRLPSGTIFPGEVAVDPVSASALIVRWRSPFTGIVRVRGFLADLDHTKGNEVIMQLSKVVNVGSNPATFANLQVRNGEAQSLAEEFVAADLQELPVTNGEFLNFHFVGFQNTALEGSAGRNLALVQIEIDEVLIPVRQIQARSAPSGNRATGQGFLDGVTRAGDPVDTIFGNFTLQETDLAVNGARTLGGFTRSYSSALPEDGLLGWGWSLSYDLRVQKITDSIFDVHRGDGRVDRYAKSGNTFTPAAGNFDALASVPAGGFTLITRDGSLYTFNAAGRLASLSDRAGANVLTIGYTGDFWTSVTEPSGRIWKLAYGKNGRLSAITDPARRTVKYAYDAAGHLVSVTNAVKGVTRFTYDAEHRLLTIADPRKVVTTRNTYDANGKVITQMDARGGTHSFAYFTDRTVFTDPLGGEWTTFFDANFRVTAREDALGNMVSFTYNVQGLVATETDARGGVTTHSYDAAGRRTSLRNQTGDTTAFAYDVSGNLLSVTDPLGHTTTYTYDGFGRVTSALAADGALTTYTVRPDGLIASVTDALSGVTAFTYDAEGNRTKITGPDGAESTFKYDAAGRVTEQADPLGRKTKTVYDAADRIRMRIAADGGRTKISYNVIGQVTAQIDPLSRKTTSTYNTAGDLIAIKDAARRTTQFSYDGLGRRTRTTLPDATAYTATYDALSRVVSTSTPLMLATTFTYDANGNVLTTTDPSARTTAYAYDAANRQTSITDALGGTTTFAYDGAGNRTTITDALGRVTTFTYDAANRLLSETNAAAATSARTYDALGRLATSTNAAGEMLAFSYDAAGRVLVITHDPALSPIVHTYDAAGTRTSTTDAFGTATFTSDAMGRLISAAHPVTGTLTYKYDKAGRRTRVTLPDGAKISTVFDKRDAIFRSTTGKVKVTYFYDAVGRSITQLAGNGVVTRFTRDADGRLIGTTTSKGTQELFRADYSLDPQGNIAGISGTETATFSYDALHRLTSAELTAEGAAHSYAYTYDGVGNRVSSTEDGVAKTYTHDLAHRLTGVNGTAVTHDATGRLTNDGASTYSYDYFGRMTGVVGPLAATYEYDSSGNLLRETVGGVATEYLVDANLTLPARLRAVRGGTVLHTNVHANGFAAQLTPSGATIYQHTDRLGSIRLRTIATGGVIERLHFAPFGAQIGGFQFTGDFGFTGEPCTLSGALTHLRARNYSPALGRFLTPDPIFQPAGTQSINNYSYVQNNPVNFADPTGAARRHGGFLGFILGIVGLNPEVQPAPEPSSYSPPPQSIPPPPVAPQPRLVTPPTPASLIGNAGGTLIGNAGGTLIGNAGGTLIGNAGGTLIGNAGGTLIGNAGGTLIGNAGGTLIGNAGGTLIGNAGGTLLGDAGASLRPGAETALLNLNGGSVINGNGSTVINGNGSNIISEGGVGFRIQSFSLGSTAQPRGKLLPARPFAAGDITDARIQEIIGAAFGLNQRALGASRGF